MITVALDISEERLLEIMTNANMMHIKIHQVLIDWQTKVSISAQGIEQSQ